MATQRNKSVPKPKRTTVSMSVRVDVLTHAKISAAAALAGMDKSSFCLQLLNEGLQGVVVFDRKKGSGQGDISGQVDRADVA